MNSSHPSFESLYCRIEGSALIYVKRKPSIDTIEGFKYHLERGSF